MTKLKNAIARSKKRNPMMASLQIPRDWDRQTAHLHFELKTLVETKNATCICKAWETYQNLNNAGDQQGQSWLGRLYLAQYSDSFL